MATYFRRRIIFIGLYFILFLLWLSISKDPKPFASLGINVFSIIAYLVTLIWLIQSYKVMKDKQQRNFWLFFAIGIGFLFLSKLATSYHGFLFILGSEPMVPGTEIQNYPIEDMIRLVGYLFFFTGFMYKMKVMKNTLPMLRFLLNVIIVIISVFSVSWVFLVNPILEGNQDVTHIGFLLSSLYHVLNISLLFAAGCIIYISQAELHQKISFYLIAAGFFIQVIGDFFYINHVNQIGYWLFLLWPVSIFLLGIAATVEQEHPWNPDKENEKLEYKNYSLSFISAGILLLLTFVNQLDETNLLQKGLHLTVLLLLFQQVITAVENKAIFSKLKHLANSEGHFHSSKQSKDDSEMAKLLNKIETLAHYDPLTNLPNRNLFQKRMDQRLKLATEKGKHFSLMYIDLDRFKYVNDSLGHDNGDILLKEVANRLHASVDDKETVARIGGDEFAIILTETDRERLIQIANQLLHKFEAPFLIQGHEIYTTPSIGISIYPVGGANTNELLKSADVAMYLAKDEGKNKFKFFNPGLNEMMIKKMQLEAKLRRGLEENRLSLYYQPQVDLRTEKIIGLEALIRWHDPELGMVSPVEFIPIAEETGLIEPIGRWVIQTACQQLKEWQKIGLMDVTMSVNVSIRQFQNAHFVNDVSKILAETKLEPQYLKIEITESILQNINKTRHVLNDLRALGIQIAIDDFGTGYSSLSYLKNLPVNTLKIDKAFIDELTFNPDGPIVKTIIDMGRNMNFTVIAEGIESKEHVDFLRDNKCFIGQGFLFSKPLPAIELERILQAEIFVTNP
ncbi:putative bifunctional diguanylate cyclase/phosphodiesterase [Neobacillus jeddahensis]|uniref:putative bifunctional diguanylate cyclase/phosphodiesterase n=1 Tax=Neobacillus jeddahensis TaxID=1461580 RepID=UPI0006937647|nr:EAL domain-containing protein [Neobacillus jeddahensis]